MSDLSELYQELILDHSRRPRHFGPLDPADLRAEGHNPLCGDRITVFVRTDGERITDLTFQGSGCAISTASASLMTEALRGATPAEIESRFRAFHDLVTGQLGSEQAAERLGKLAALGGVCKFPVRVKCATLPWHTLRAALERGAAAREAPPPTVTTEGTDA